jgi:probable F420-dependent oxidoreductase
MRSLRVYATMDQRMGLDAVEAHARRVEALGYDGLCVPDAVHDGLLLAHAALRVTTRLSVATSVLVAFPRSPMMVAIAAWDLAALSGGRFELGLGSQVRGNIERRYSTPWVAPVARMRDYVRSLRAIFATFQHGAPLAFEGEHYRFTRLQPFFNPGSIAHPEIPIHLGGVGPKMTALAGEVADGFMTHPTNTSPRFLRESVRPTLAAGAERGGRDVRSLELMVGGFVATGRDAAAVARERAQIRQLLTFLYSTPTYWPTLDLFGWRDVGERLHRLSREGKWAEMAGAVDDAMLDALVPQGPYDRIAAVLQDWYGALATRITFPVPADPADDAAAARAIATLRS